MPTQAIEPQRVCRCDHGKDCVCTYEEKDWDANMLSDGEWDEFPICRCLYDCYCKGKDVREGNRRRAERNEVSK